MADAITVLRDFHQKLGAKFISQNDCEIISDYGDVLQEHRALTETAGLLDLNYRGRICLTGEDRVRFLHGQVTNDVNGLKVGDGCYAALITAKGRMQSDLNIYRLKNELLLDFEPNLTPTVSERLERYVISEDVQIVDVQVLYGLISIQGPKAKSAMEHSGLFETLPEKPLKFVQSAEAGAEIYVVNHPRFGTTGYDLFVPAQEMLVIFERLKLAINAIGGRVCGWSAAEIARIEAGIPRFGQDMDETNLPLEAGIAERAISVTKGCYIGQEVISRIRTYSETPRVLRGLRLPDTLQKFPLKGDILFKDGKEAGYITSAIHSPSLNANIGLGYVRKEANQTGAELILRSGGMESLVRIVDFPFAAKPASGG